VHNLVVDYGSGMPDDNALERQVCFALYSASRATTAAYRTLLADLGVTYPQYLVLMVLWERDARGVRELSEILDLDTGTMSPLLKRLEALGLIERRRLSTDERRVQIHLTTAGSALRERSWDIPGRLALATGLSGTELEQLRDTLTRVRDTLHDPHHSEELS
jgi:MarR family transcriptional regulator, organic hydroperoxide resistance regulator